MNRLTTRSDFAFPSLTDIGRNLFLTDDLFSGMDEFFKDVKFPKYNTIVRGDDMEIEIALAGYAKEDIDVELTPENVLVVSSTDMDEVEDADEYTYVHHGIASRNFKIAWKIGLTHKVGDITYIDGMLRIPLKSKAPDKPKTKSLKIK